jgi:uncharacterized protein YbjT (DUF2867 family)
MKIIVFGASQGLGAQVVARALEEGHAVTAFARHPDRLTDHPKLRKYTGDVLDAKAVAAACQGQDAAVITLGMPTLQAMGFGRHRTIADGTRNVIMAAEAAGIRKLVTETAIGTGDSVQDVSLLSKLAYRVVLRWLFRQKDEQEALTRSSSLDWTIVRPTALTNGPRAGARTGRHLSAGLLTHVSRADVAEVIMRAVTDPRLSRQTITASYERQWFVRDFGGWLRHYRG